MWYNRFKEGRENVNDDTSPGPPNAAITDENIEAVKKMILDNRRITIRDVADDVDTRIAFYISGFAKPSVAICQLRFTYSERFYVRALFVLFTVT